jgi:putative DNA primase/helicase
MDVFTASKHDRHSTEIAKMAGARLVTATEVTEGREWNETRLKTLTGGDKVSARFLFRDAFEFEPQFFLMISGNHKPGLKNVTDAMRRRLQFVPFSNRPAVADPQLKAILRSEKEMAGILRWMIDGCLLWQAEGISPPERVSTLTADYFQEQDKFNQWFEEEALMDPKSKVKVEDLYESMCRYLAKTGVEPKDIAWFTEQMERPCPGVHDGFKKCRAHRKRADTFYQGLRLKTPGEKEDLDQPGFDIL